MIGEATNFLIKEYVQDKTERDTYYAAAENPQDNLTHTIYIGVIAYINTIVPPILWA